MTRVLTAGFFWCLLAAIVVGGFALAALCCLLGWLDEDL